MASANSYLSGEAEDNFFAEDIPVVVETPDYSDVRVTPVGEYLSAVRSLTKVTTKPDGATTFELTLTGGVQSLDGSETKWGTGKFPFRTWISTKLYDQQGRPGKTSSVAQYLKEAGFDVKTLKTMADVKEAVAESLTIPLKVFVGWRDRGVKQADGSYRDLKLKTKDFETGRDENGAPIYSPVIERDGEKIQATERIGNFRSFQN